MTLSITINSRCSGKYRFRGRRSTFASTLCELGDGKMQKTLALCVNWASGLCANHLGCDACTAAVSERSRNGLGTGSETGPLARPRAGFARFELRGRRSTFARSSIEFVAGAALSQGQVSISWQAQHFRKHSLRAGGWQDAENVGAVRELGFRTVRKPPRLRRLYGGGLGTVSERSRNGLGTGSETGPLARPREGFARLGLRGRRSAFARSSIDFVAGAAISQGQVSISWQAQHFRKVLRPLSPSWGMARCRKRWRCA